MAETADKKTKKEIQKSTEAVQIETGAIEADEANTFTTEEIARMLKVKSEIKEGRYSDVTDEHKKLLFVQWMIDNGKLNS